MIEEASMEMNDDMKDPFSEIGMAVPPELPYVDENDAKNSLMKHLSVRYSNSRYIMSNHFTVNR